MLTYQAKYTWTSLVKERGGKQWLGGGAGGGHPCEFCILTPQRGEPWRQRGGFQNSHRKEEQLRLTVYLPCLMVIHQSPNSYLFKPTPSQEFLYLTQQPKWKERAANQGGDHIHVLWVGAFFEHYILFPKAVTASLSDSSLCISLSPLVSPEHKTEKCDPRPAHTWATCLSVSSSWPAPYLGHFVHRDWNSVNGERGQLWVNLLWCRGVFCQGRLQVFQDHTLVLAHLQGIKGRSKQDAPQPGRVGAKQPEGGWGRPPQP